MTSFLQFSLVRRLSDYKWHSCQVYIDQIQRCLLYMLSTCFQCVFWSFLLSCSARNQTKLITLCPTSTGMKLGPCAAASNPWLFFAGITIAYHFVRPGFHIRYTLKLSAAVQNRSPTPAICPSYANPVVSIVPKQLSVNLRPGFCGFLSISWLK